MYSTFCVFMQKSKVPRSFVGSGASESTGSVLLFDVLAMMDTFAQAHEPLDTSVWVAIAAAPLIAAECKAAAKQRRARARRAAAAAAAGGTAVAEPAAERSCGGPGEASPAPADKSNGTESAWGTVEEDGTTPSAAACTAEYLEAYGKIVDKVMLRLLSPVDAKTQRLLLPAAEDEVVTSSASKLKHGDQTSAPRTGFLLLACLLPRQAVETAADMLKMEAELRGGPLPEALPEGNRRARRGRKRGASKRTWLSRSEATVLDVLRRPEVRWGAETDLGL